MASSGVTGVDCASEGTVAGRETTAGGPDEEGLTAGNDWECYLSLAL